MRRLICLVAVFCAMSAPVWAAPNNDAGARRVLVLVANRLTLDDIDNPALPRLARLLARSQLGLISPNCVGYKSPEAVMLTASVGRSSRGGLFVRDFYDESEMLSNGGTAGLEHFRRTGYRPAAMSAAFLGLAEALRANQAGAATPVQLGALGASISAVGGRTCVVGNSDDRDGPDRAAAVLAMDHSGRVDFGWLQQVSVHPLTHLPDVDGLAAVADRHMNLAELVVLDFGAFSRLAADQQSMSDASIERHRQHLLAGLDQLVGRLVAVCESRDAVLVLASFAPPEADIGMRLTPIAVYDPDSSSGALTSPTTRTPGLIAATDFAPTILRLMNVAQAMDLQGRPASVAAGSHGLGAIRLVDTRVTAHRRVIAPLAWAFLLIGGVSSIAAALVLWQPRLRKRWAVAAIKVGLLTIALAHASMMVAVLAPASAGGYYAGVAAFMAVGCIIALVVGRALDRRLSAAVGPVLVAYAITVAVVLIDTTAGGGLMRYTAASSFQMSGMRYYGIGNEYAAALISMSAVLTLVAAVRVRRGWLLAAAVGALVVAFLGLGRLGANYGGTVAAVATFYLLAVAVGQGGFRARHVALGAAGGVLAAVALALLESKIAGAGGSHAGRMAGLVEATGGGYLLDVVRRKALMNLRILVHPIALKGYLLFVPCLALWVYRLRHDLRAGVLADKRALAGAKAIAYGALIGLLVNDSGIIMGGILLAMLALVLLYSLLSPRDARAGG